MFVVQRLRVRTSTSSVQAAAGILCTHSSPQGALKEGARTMLFMDKTIDVDRNAGIFVTLNPAGKGYGGRSKLPDNLKQLFRCGSGISLWLH